MRRRRLPPINQAITQTAELSMKIPGVSKIKMRITNQVHSTAPAQSITNANDEATHKSPMIKDIPFCPDPTYRPPPKPVRAPMPESLQSSDSTNIDPEINIDFEKNYLFEEGIVSEIYQRPDKTFFQEPQELADIINNSNLIQRPLPRQTDIDKMLKVIQSKVLKGTHLPVTIKEIQARWKHWQKNICC